MEEKYIVYWYKLKGHNNPNTEGYIGVTNNMYRRNLEHIRTSKKKKTHFYNAINKYGIDNITFEILHEVDNEELAYELEYSYRPSNNIGWNSATGGTDTLKKCVSKPVKMYHKDNYVILHKFKSMTEAAISIGIGEGRIRQSLFRKTKTYGYDGWAILHDDNFDRSSNIDINELRKINNTGLKRTKPNPRKGMKLWTEEQKQEIGNFHKGKKLSEEHINILKNFNRENSPKAKEIKLYNIDDITKIYTYHSISEASRQLNIPLSRLKSKAQRPINRIGKDGWAIKYLGL